MFGISGLRTARFQVTHSLTFSPALYNILSLPLSRLDPSISVRAPLRSRPSLASASRVAELESLFMAVRAYINIVRQDTFIEMSLLKLLKVRIEKLLPKRRC